MIRINLVPPEFLDKQKQRMHVVKVSAGVVLVALLILGFSLRMVSRSGALAQELAGKQLQLGKLQSKVEEVNRYQEIKNRVKAHLDAINTLLSSRLYYAYFMQDILKALPSGVWFNSLSSGYRDPGVIDATIHCSALSGDDIAKLVDNLEQQPELYSGVTLGPITVATPGYSFPLTITYVARGSVK